MLENGFILSVNSTILMYCAIALNGMLMLLTLWYVHSKFRQANGALARLKRDWDSAENTFSDFTDLTRQQLTRLASTAGRTKPDRGLRVSFETRNQIVAMSKKGLSSADISQSSGLPEGEVDVMLRIARMQQK